MKLSPFALAFVIAAATGNTLAQDVYDNAEACADAYLAAHPTLHSDWIKGNLNGYLGGREGDNFVGSLNMTGTEFPPVGMMDGPAGVRNIRNGIDFPEKVSWASAASIGQSWSPEVAYFVGKIQAEEFKMVDANMALSPGVEVHRVPTNGRNCK
jgi:hypothetical protein